MCLYVIILKTLAAKQRAQKNTSLRELQESEELVHLQMTHLLLVVDSMFCFQIGNSMPPCFAASSQNDEILIKFRV